MVIYTILLGSVPASFETSVPNYRRVSTGPHIWVLRACCNPHSLLLFPVPSPDVQVWTSLALWFYFFLLSPLSELAFSVLICGIISLSSSCAGCLDVSRQLLPLPVFFSSLPSCNVALPFSICPIVSPLFIWVLELQVLSFSATAQNVSRCLCGWIITRYRVTWTSQPNPPPPSLLSEEITSWKYVSFIYLFVCLFYYF